MIRSSLMIAPIPAHTLPREAQSPADEHRKVSGAWSARPPPPVRPQTPSERREASRAGVGRGGRARRCADPDEEAAPAGAPAPQAPGPGPPLGSPPQVPGVQSPQTSAQPFFLARRRRVPAAPHPTHSAQLPSAGHPRPPHLHPRPSPPSPCPAAPGLPAWMSWGFVLFSWP